MCVSGNISTLAVTFEITLTLKASDDLKALRKIEQKAVTEGIERQLKTEPATETRNRKKLRPNGTAEWELRIGNLRVIYDVFEGDLVVKIEAIGYKAGNKLFVRGEEFKL